MLSANDFLEIQPAIRRCLKDNVFSDGVTARDALQWCVLLQREDSAQHRLYRALDVDPEIDVELFVQRKWNDYQKIRKHAQPVDRQLMVHELKTAWRYFMRRYAFWRAVRVLTKLAVCNPEWLLPRVVSLFLPRLVIATGVGLLAILSSGELTRFARTLACSPDSARNWLISCVLIGWVLCWFEVQRRVGRQFGNLLLRSAGLLIWGLAVAMLMSYLVEDRIWVSILNELMLPSGAKWVLGGGSLVLGQVLQSFWEEGSIGDPL